MAREIGDVSLKRKAENDVDERRINSLKCRTVSLSNINKY